MGKQHRCWGHPWWAWKKPQPRIIILLLLKIAKLHKWNEGKRALLWNDTLKSFWPEQALQPFFAILVPGWNRDCLHRRVLSHQRAYAHAHAVCFQDMVLLTSGSSPHRYSRLRPQHLCCFPILRGRSHWAFGPGLAEFAVHTTPCSYHTLIYYLLYTSFILPDTSLHSCAHHSLFLPHPYLLVHIIHSSWHQSLFLCTPFCFCAHTTLHHPLLLCHTNLAPTFVPTLFLCRPTLLHQSNASSSLLQKRRTRCPRNTRGIQKLKRASILLFLLLRDYSFAQDNASPCLGKQKDSALPDRWCSVTLVGGGGLAAECRSCNLLFCWFCWSNLRFRFTGPRRWHSARTK